MTRQSKDRDTGILTFHRTHNFGAFLQAYAMTRTIAEFGYTPYVINYESRSQWMSEAWPVMRKFRRPVRFVDFAKKHCAFGRVLKDLPLTDYTRNPQDLQSEHFRRAVVGSDIVWNYLLHGPDSPFFGALNADRLVAYAPCVGWASPSDPPPDGLAEALARFDAIAVRDRNSQEIIKTVTGRDVPIVLDPTLLWDFAGSETCPGSKCFQRPYLLVYAFDMTADQAAELRRFAEARGLQVLGIGYRLRHNPCDKVLMDISPFDFLWAVKHAEFVFTNTFHGSLFAIKYAKAFGVSMGPSVEPKLKPLLDRLGLNGREVEAGTDIDAVLTQKADFAAAHSQLRQEAGNSVAWLQEALSS